jgi:outer membrane receptor protein involved in Fe transport
MKTRLSKTDRLLAGTILAGVSAVILAGPAMAQDANPAPDPQPEEEIVVTGTRAPRPDYAYSNPVTSVDGQALQYSGAVNLTDFLEELPALTNAQDANDSAGANAFIGGAGINLLNLRNLGVDRTLVLVNGRRHVASLPGSAAIDTATIPIDLIERVDISTGGASAVYGADGVSGVVNFILDDDFDGLRIRGQTGWTQEGGAEETFISGVWGVTTDGGRANLTIAAEYTKEDALLMEDRDFTRGENFTQLFPNPDDAGDDPNIFDNLPFDNGRSALINDIGAIDTNFDTAFDFNGDGTPWDNGLPLDASFQQGGSGTLLSTLFGDILPETERYSFNGFFHYELSERAELFTELKYVHAHALTAQQPTFDQFLLIPGDNLFVPQAALDDFNANLPDLPVPFMLFSRMNFDLGQRAEDATRQTYRGVFGLRGDLSEHVKYNISFVYGQTDTDTININNRYNDRFLAAIDVVDADPGPGIVPQCRSNLDPDAAFNDPNTFIRGLLFADPSANYPTPISFTPGPGSGCVPLNVFGPNVSQAAVDWVNVDTTTFSSITQTVFQAYLSGTLDSWFQLPGGSVGFAAGVEWREETSESRFDPRDQSGATFFNVIADSFGEYDASEVFAELSLPLLKDRPLFDSLALDGAVRLSDYSTVGQTTTWKVGGVWAPIADITFRGTVAEAVRAPNIGELFSPASQQFAFINDPCDFRALNNGTEFREANCAAILSGFGIDPATFEDPNAATVSGIQTGTPTLNAETAETLTLGVILRPRFIPGLVVSLDWYDIELADAIVTSDPEEIAENCVDLPTIDNVYCDALTRSPASGGIVDFVQQPFNVAHFTTRGVDFSVVYTFEPADWGWGDWGRFSARVIGNRLEDLTFVNLPGAEPDSDLGEANAPEWQTNFDLRWEKGPLTLNYGFNYFSETQRFTLQERQDDPDIAPPEFLNYNARSTHDVQVRYDFGDRLVVYGGVNNLTDQEPDLDQPYYPVGAEGRTFYAGLNARLN